MFPSPLLNGIKPAIKYIHVNPTITSTRLCNVDNFKMRSYFSAGSVNCKIMGRSCLLLKRHRGLICNDTLAQCYVILRLQVCSVSCTHASAMQGPNLCACFMVGRGGGGGGGVYDGGVRV